jgi:hypothetical protein
MGRGRVFFGRHRRLLGEIHALEESIAQRSRRSQRGMGRGRVFFGRQRQLPGEKHTLGESIAQRSRRSQRGDGLWQGVLWATPAASGRETRARGKASHRGHGGHRGGMSFGRRHIRFSLRRHALRRPADPFLPAQALWWTPWLSCTKNSYSCQTATGAD